MKNYIEKQNNTAVIHTDGFFSLSDTLNCGQCFRFDEIDGRFCGIAKGHYLKAYQMGNEIILENCDDAEFWFDFFDMGRDYGEIYREITKNEILRQSADAAKGVHILKQEFFETLCSFIFSQNNNIPRIKKIVASFCENFGEKTGFGYLFPTAERVANLDITDLAPLRCGFRDKYIMSAAGFVANGEISEEKLQKMTFDEARNSLMRIKGVGEKVADCVLLYGLGRIEAFPRDVWIKRIMAEIMPKGLPEELKEVAGIAQQYLFHYNRNIK